MGLPRRIKQMRVLGIVLIISLGCLSALDFEAGDDFEAGHAGVNEIIEIPKTDAAEEVLPQTTVKGRTAQRFFNVREKNRKRLKAREVWKKRRHAWLHAKAANRGRSEKVRKFEKHRKERLVKHKIWVKTHKKLMKEKAKKKKKHAKEEAKKEKKAKKNKTKERKKKKKAKEKLAKDKRKKERKAKRMKRTAREKKSKAKRKKEKLAKLVKEKKRKKYWLGRIHNKEKRGKLKSKLMHAKLLKDNKKQHEKKAKESKAKSRMREATQKIKKGLKG